MPDKKNTPTMIVISPETLEHIKVIKRQLSAKLNATLDNPQTVAYIVEFYLKEQQKETNS